MNDYNASEFVELEDIKITLTNNWSLLANIDIVEEETGDITATPYEINGNFEAPEPGYRLGICWIHPEDGLGITWMEKEGMNEIEDYYYEIEGVEKV